jgi:hypothetical protein
MPAKPPASQKTQIAAERHGDAAASAKGNHAPIRWAACFAVSLPLIVLNCGWIANSEIRSDVTEVTISTLFMGVTFLLFLVTLLNLLCRAWFGRRGSLGQAEMMVVYTMLSISSVVAGVGHMGFFTPFLTAPFWYGKPSNGWPEFWYLLPSYIGPRDPQVLHPFYEGHSTFFQPLFLRAWAMPLLIWSAFFLALLWTTLCLASILRRRWADEEHLPFPIVVLPLEMTQEGAPIYRSAALWAGFAVPAFLHSLNSLQSVYPTLPYLHINSVHDLVTDAPLQVPWTGADTLFYMLHPSGVGFGYLINTDVSFSLWFFYLLKKALGIWGVMENWRDPSQGWFGDEAAQFPYTGYQGMGAWLALGLAALWAGRGYFRDYLRRAWRGDLEGVDRDEPMSARAAVTGAAVGFLALCVFVWSSGGSWWLPAAFIGIYLLIMIALTRIRAETAVLSTELIWVDPQNILPLLSGTESLSRTDLAHMGMLSWFNTDYRAAGMPHELEGLVGLGRANGRLRPLIGAILAAAAVALAAALIFDLQMYYVYGAGTAKVNSWRIAKGEEPWSDLQRWIQNPKPPDLTGIAGMAVGVAVTFFLAALRQRFPDFPLHPAAYVLNASFANDFFWCDMFVAWLIKSLILRYRGMTFYRQCLPFFLGLILGDFVVGSVWSLIGTVLHLDLFRTFAN